MVRLKYMWVVVNFTCFCQVVCTDCNHTKGNRSTDYLPIRTIRLQLLNYLIIRSKDYTTLYGSSKTTTNVTKSFEPLWLKDKSAPHLE